jgi:hypothetical protein
MTEESTVIFNKRCGLFVKSMVVSAGCTSRHRAKGYEIGLQTPADSASR